MQTRKAAAEMSAPAITVLVDTYNHERFIEEALASVLAQDFPAADTEILVVDDGSTDRTPEIVRRFAPRVRLLRKENGGQASAFNAGIAEARGRIVAFLDGDDWWAPNKLTRISETFSADPSIGFVGQGIVMVQLDGSTQTETLREASSFQANSFEGACLFRVRGSQMGTSRMSIRREVLDRIGPVPDAIKIQADEYLFTLACAIAPARIIPDPLTYYRVHEANGFHLSSFDAAKVRHKWLSYIALAETIDRRLRQFQIDARARRAIVEMIETNRDQLRLMLEGGTPWEMFATEWKLYRVQLPDTTPSHRAFKALTLLAAMTMSPRAFYRFHRWITQNEAYRLVRKKWLPPPQIGHLDRRYSSLPDLNPPVSPAANVTIGPPKR
jgi:glycosyltransferase involved in cell wall biosynthesis